MYNGSAEMKNDNNDNNNNNNNNNGNNSNKNSNVKKLECGINIRGRNTG